MLTLITGATSGIGEACAKLLAQNGSDLLLLGRREEKLKSLARQLAEHGVKIFTQVCDLKQRDQINDVFEIHKELLQSHFTTLVNNAGLALGLDFFQNVGANDFHRFDEMIDINLKSLLYVTHKSLPFLLKRKQQGHIVNIGSVAGHFTYPKGNVYCATKFAVRAFNEALRQDLNGTGVRVTSIDPGMVETEFSEVRFSGDKAKAKAVYAGMTPLQAEDVAQAVLWSVQRPTHVNVQEIVLYPTDQASPTLVNRV